MGSRRAPRAAGWPECVGEAGRKIARIRPKNQTFDPEFLRELAARIPDDADEHDPDVYAFAEHYGQHAYHLGLAGLFLPLYTTRGGGLLLGLGHMTPREIREDTLSWLAVQRG